MLNSRSQKSVRLSGGFSFQSWKSHQEFISVYTASLRAHCLGRRRLQLSLTSLHPKGNKSGSGVQQPFVLYVLNATRMFYRLSLGCEQEEQS